jgi:hypothetical protein
MHPIPIKTAAKMGKNDEARIGRLFEGNAHRVNLGEKPRLCSRKYEFTLTS